MGTLLSYHHLPGCGTTVALSNTENLGLSTSTWITYRLVPASEHLTPFDVTLSGPGPLFQQPARVSELDGRTGQFQPEAQRSKMQEDRNSACNWSTSLGTTAKRRRDQSPRRHRKYTQGDQIWSTTCTGSGDIGQYLLSRSISIEPMVIELVRGLVTQGLMGAHRLVGAIPGQQGLL